MGRSQDIDKREELKRVFTQNLKYLIAEESVFSVCERLGINRSQFNRYLYGQSLPDSETLVKICEFFGVDERILSKSLAELKNASPVGNYSAQKALQLAIQRLLHAGWRLGDSCPKDGSEFAIIEFGSEAIFVGYYDWEYGMLCYEDDMHHQHGTLWKPIEELTDAESQRASEDTGIVQFPGSAEIVRFPGTDEG